MYSPVKISGFLLFLLLVLLGISCSQSEDDGAYYISSDYMDTQKEILLSGDETSIYIGITATCDWRFTYIPSWVKLDYTEGYGYSNLEMSFEENPSASHERVDSLILETATMRRAIHLVQSKATEKISLNTSSLDVLSAGGIKKLSVFSNTDWSVKGVENWLEIDKTSGSGNSELSILVLPNETEIARKAILTIQGDSYSLPVTLTQAGVVRQLSVSPLTLNAPATAGSQTLTLMGDATWSITSDVPWVTFDKMVGTGSDVVAVHYKDNAVYEARTATVTISYSNNEYVCTLIQEAPSHPKYTLNKCEMNRYSLNHVMHFTALFPITEYGAYLSTSENFVTSDKKISYTGNACECTFQALFENLTSGTSYYVRFYLVTICGTEYTSIYPEKTLGIEPGSDDIPTPALIKKRNK